MEHTSDATMDSLQHAIENELLSWPEVTTKTMFGHPVFLVRGVLFALLADRGIVLTFLTEQQRMEVSQQFSSHPFIGHGNPIPSWIHVEMQGKVDLTRLLPFLHHSHENALQKSTRTTAR